MKSASGSRGTGNGRTASVRWRLLRISACCVEPAGLARGHAEERLRTVEEDVLRYEQRFVPSELALVDFFTQDFGKLFPNDDRFGVGPFHTVSIREEADLLVDRQHVEPLGDDLADDVGEEIVPPITGQTEVWEFARERAERLIG